MLRYLLKRFLLFLPTLLLLSFLAFGLSQCTVGDPVEQMLSSEGAMSSFTTYTRYQREYATTARELGLDRPVFYLSVQPAAYPDTLHRVVQQSRRNTLRRLLDYYGNWPALQDYYRGIMVAEATAIAARDDYRADALTDARRGIQQLFSSDDPHRLPARLDSIRAAAATDSTLRVALLPAIDQLRARYDYLANHPTPGRLLVPAVRWYGFDNQYHRWLTDLLRGDFGYSYRQRRPVREVIGNAVGWTVLINGLALLLAYLISVPIGVYTAVRRGTRFDRWTTLLLFLLYSLPNFWIATLLTVFITNPMYGMDWFPARGIGTVAADASWWEAISTRAPYFVLPVFCLTYGSLAFISRQLRGAMVGVLDSDYIRTARARGLPAGRVVWKHALRNALFPLITLLADVLPLAFAGSVVIEYIFNIPGMGKLTVDAIHSQDWPVVYILLMLSGVITIVGILLADILYALADPRVSYGTSR